MADINKSALLIFDEAKIKFLVNRKSKNDVTSKWLMPGGSIEEGETIADSLIREIKEELSCELDPQSLRFIGEYEAPAAGQEHKKVAVCTMVDNFFNSSMICQAKGGRYQ